METIRREIELDNVYTEIVCDRSVIDNYCYLEFRLRRQPALFDLACYWAATYDLLFKVPIRPEYLPGRRYALNRPGVPKRHRRDHRRSSWTKPASSTQHFTTLDDAVEQARLACGRLPIA